MSYDGVMELMVIRHGIAEDVQPDQADADRVLTDKGIKRTQTAAQGLGRVADRPDVILTSPKARARQTAAIIAEFYDREPQTMHELGEDSPEKIMIALHKRKESRVAIVGHEPVLSELVEMICTNNTAHGFIELKKAGCIMLEAPIEQSARPGYGRLIWSLTPRVLRALA